MNLYIICVYPSINIYTDIHGGSLFLSTLSSHLMHPMMGKYKSIRVFFSLLYLLDTEASCSLSGSRTHLTVKDEMVFSSFRHTDWEIVSYKLWGAYQAFERIINFLGSYPLCERDFTCGIFPRQEHTAVLGFFTFSSHSFYSVDRYGVSYETIFFPFNTYFEVLSFVFIH